MDAWAEGLFGLQEAKSPHSWNPGSKHGTEREKFPISPSGRGANPLWASTTDLLPNQSSRAHAHTSSVFTPMGFLLFCRLFFPWLLLYIPARGQGEEAHLNWEWICCNSQQPGASFLLLMGLCCFLRQCSGTEMLPFFSYSISLGSCLIPAMTVFVGAVFHCQAEPSHLHPNVSLSLKDQPYVFPLDFPQLQLYSDIKPVENRSISPFVSWGQQESHALLPGFTVQGNCKNIWKKDLGFEAFPPFLNKIALG